MTDHLTNQPLAGATETESRSLISKAGETLREKVARALFAIERGSTIEWAARSEGLKDQFRERADRLFADVPELALRPPPVPRKEEEALINARRKLQPLIGKFDQETASAASAGLSAIDGILSSLRQPSALDSDYPDEARHDDCFLGCTRPDNVCCPDDTCDKVNGVLPSALDSAGRPLPSEPTEAMRAAGYAAFLECEFAESGVAAAYRAMVAAAPSALDSGDGGEVGR